MLLFSLSFSISFYCHCVLLLLLELLVMCVIGMDQSFVSLFHLSVSVIPRLGHHFFLIRSIYRLSVA